MKDEQMKTKKVVKIEMKFLINLRVVRRKSIIFKNIFSEEYSYRIM